MIREELLETKKREIIVELERWAEDQKILGPNETISLEMQIRKSPISGEVIDVGEHGHPLPPDEEYQTFHLSEADWSKLDTLQWHSDYRRVFELLRGAQQRGVCVPRKALSRTLCFPHDGPFTRSFNAVLNRASTYEGVRGGYYYRLKPIKDGSQLYAICRYGSEKTSSQPSQ